MFFPTPVSEPEKFFRDQRSIALGSSIEPCIFTFSIPSQRRALTVNNFPGLFGISVAGHVNAGEFSSDAAKREIEEELGINAAQLKFDFILSFFREAILNEMYIDRHFNDVYVTRADIKPKRIQFDRSEVSEVKFVSFESFREMVLTESADLAPVYAEQCRDLVYFLGGLFA